MTVTASEQALVIEASREFAPTSPLEVSYIADEAIVGRRPMMENFATERFAHYLPRPQAASLAHELCGAWLDTLSQTPWCWAEYQVVRDAALNALQSSPDAQLGEAVLVGTTNSWYLFAAAVAAGSLAEVDAYAGHYLVEFAA